MQQTELIEYITEGIIRCLDRDYIFVPSEAADDVAQLALLREYVALGFAAERQLRIPQ